MYGRGLGPSDVPQAEKQHNIINKQIHRAAKRSFLILGIASFIIFLAIIAIV